MKKIVGLIRYIFQILITLLSIFVFLGCETKQAKDPLTPEEREWLTKYDGNIAIALETSYAPFAFVDENGIGRGLATEYIELIEKKLNFRIKKIQFNSLNEILNSAQKKEIDIVNAVTETQDRSKYLLFTKPFIKIPNVIIVRKDRKDSLTIDKIKNMKISLVKNYAVTEHLTQKYNELDVVLMPDDLSTLMSVSFNQTDATIIDLATASYFIEQKGITNLRIAGESGYSINLAIASRNDWPILNRILEKGLSSITDKEKKSIKDKWISFGKIRLSESKEFWIIIITAFLVFLLAIVGIMVWNRLLTNQVEQRTIQLKKELAVRNQSEKELKQLKLQLSNALDMAHLGHWEYDVVNDLFIFNDHFYKIFGTAAEQVGGYSMSSAEYARRFVHPDDMYMVQEETRKAIETDSPDFNSQFEHRMLYANGEVGYVNVRYFIVKDAHGKTVKTYGVNQDITNRKKAEESLKESKIFLENMSDIAYMADNEGNLTWVNSSVERITGLSVEEIKGKSFLPLFVEKDHASLKDVYKRTLMGESLENTLTFTSGVICHFTSLPKRNDKGEIIGTFGVARDITETRRIEEKLRQSLDLLVNFACLVPGVIYQYRLNPDGSSAFPWSSPGMNDIYEVTPEEVKKDATPVFGRLHPEDLEMVSNAIQESARTLNTFYCEFRVILPRQGLRWRWSQAQPERTEDGGTLWHGIISDITERKQAEVEREKLQAQLAQAQKMESIGTLAGGIAHDFNNILFPIVGHTEMLMDDLSEENSSIRDSLKEIYSGALRARDLVQQILAFARQEKNELKLMKMQPIIKEAMKLIRSTIPTTISITQNLQPDCGPVMADPTQIHQIIMNLATNAYHAMEDIGGELKVALKKIEFGGDDLINPDMSHGLYACLTIADTGVGIKKEVMDRIFDPFFTTKEKGKGTGMGLSVVHGIVNHMNGYIQVYSEPGKGTEFQVYLPIARDTSERQEQNANESILMGHERVLVVDDEAAIIIMEKMILERLGYKVLPFTSSMEALEAFRANPDKFDLVITDMSMPKMSGDKLATELIKMRPDIPVLLCTGFSEGMTDDKIKSLGIKGFLMKPIERKALAKKIREILD